MSELISGKEALIALANGEELQQCINDEWIDLRRDISWRSILGDNHIIRLKPRTITLNGIEVPATFEPACSEEYFFIVNSTLGYASSVNVESPVAFYGKWRTESEIKQVVAALRQIFK